MHHLLVTNDFPPKVGGIQNYLWELWRRFPPGSATVVTPDYHGAGAFDADQPFGVVRVRPSVLVPGPALVRTVNALVAEREASLVVLDPVAHLAPIAGRLDAPHAVVVHGAELVIPASAPLVQLAVRRTLRSAALVVAAGEYPAHAAARAAGRAVPTVVVPPGVDTRRFVPLDADERAAARRRFGLDPGSLVITSVSRLVPRKGMDRLVQAASVLAGEFPGLRVVIAGDGRDRSRLAQLVATTGAPVTLVGRVDDDDLPAFYGMGDVFAMACRNRWGGLEQEGFGIVFLEAAACGVPQVAGDSGGASDAVADGVTGVLVERPNDAGAVADALRGLLADPTGRAAMGEAARRRAREDFSYDGLAATLHDALVATATNHRPGSTS
jgi:phosphatidylinositol alpha-1,6-mannosyltransferase